jgi:membrane fusion protein (multidrug efflux system)
MSTVAELDISSAEARVPSAPARRDLRRAVRRLDLRRFGFFGLALLIGLGATWYGHQWWSVGRFIESTDDAYVGGDVTVIAPKVAGFIVEVAVTDNQAVHAGDLLVKLDDRDYRAALAKAAAAVAAQEATLANLDATRRLQESMIAQAEAEVTAADAEVARSRFDVVRYSRLVSDQYASLQRFQQADADNKKAIAAVEKARAALDAARRRIDVIDTQKQQTRAALDQIRPLPSATWHGSISATPSCEPRSMA